jgi:16S rRNA (uracil1498-N3)-methyltransferase
MRRFTIALDRITGGRVVFDPDESRHLARVVRLRPGAVIVATDGTGRDYTVLLDEVGEQAVGHILAVGTGRPESPLAITLVQGIPKGDKMETIVRAATELGVVRVVPAVCERTIVRLEPSRWRERARRWQRVAKEAAKQTGRAVIPAVDLPRPLGDCLAVVPGSLALCLWEADAPPLGDALRQRPPGPGAAAVLIGPEGGLAPAEVSAAVAAGWRVAKMGPRILRTETAGPAVLAVLQFHFGDLGRGDPGESSVVSPR